MGAYTNQDIDFVFRTQQLLKQYEKIKENNEIEGYEFTLLMNCFVGLLIIPQQANENKRRESEYLINLLPKEEINERTYGINPDDIKICVGISENGKPKPEIDKTVRNVIRHFRNSVAHNRFEVKSESKKISSVIFRDYDSNNENAKQTFQLEITATKIYNFALKISDCFLNAMANEEGSSSFKFHKEQEENFTYQEIRRMDIH